MKLAKHDQDDLGRLRRILELNLERAQGDAAATAREKVGIATARMVLTFAAGMTANGRNAIDEMLTKLLGDA